MFDKASYLVEFVFTYCTDFIINLSNALRLSYYEVNALIFCIAWPALTAALFLLLLIQKTRLKRARKGISIESSKPLKVVTR